MKQFLFLTIATSVALLLSSCDTNRELRNRVEALATESGSQRSKCEQFRDLERSSRDRRSTLRTELSELKASQEWDGIARSGDAGTQEMLIQAKKTMADPAREAHRRLDIERLQREMKLAQEDDSNLRQQRKAACDASLKSTEAYLEAKRSLEKAIAEQKS